MFQCFIQQQNLEISCSKHSAMFFRSTFSSFHLFFSTIFFIFFRLTNFSSTFYLQVFIIVSRKATVIKSLSFFLPLDWWKIVQWRCTVICTLIRGSTTFSFTAARTWNVTPIDVCWSKFSLWCCTRMSLTSFRSRTASSVCRRTKKERDELSFGFWESPTATHWRLHLPAAP